MADDPARETEKQCRICYDGPDPSLGRLIRPCLCKGSISYVHVKCLQRWRTSSPSASAFYACPQCHYKYHFARTRAVGIASNPLFVATLSTIFFTCILYVASFIATYFFEGLDDRSSYSYGYSFYFGTYFVSPFDVARDLIRLALRILRDEEIVLDNRLFQNSSKGTPLRAFGPPKPPGVIGNFIRRIVIGLPVVGVASLVHLLWSVSMLAPFHFLTRLRGRNRRQGSRDIATILILIAIVGGALRALWGVYRLTERFAKYVLHRTEDAILEVG